MNLTRNTHGATTSESASVSRSRARKRLETAVLVAVMAVCTAMSATAVRAASDNSFNVYWKHGIRMETADKAFKLRMGGRIQNDWAFYSADDKLESEVGKFEDATEFRRARLYFAGEVYERVVFKVQYDFAGGNADFKDVYIGLKDIPGLGTVKVGHFKESFSLEEITSSKYLTFLERSLPNVFVPSRNTGIGFLNSVADDRLTYSAGFFRETDGFGDSQNQAWGSSARVTGLPWYAGEDQFLHLGVDFTYRDTDSSAIKFDVRPESHTALKIVKSGSILSDSRSSYGAEAALVTGPFSLQGEYIATTVDTPDGSDPNFSGWYGQVSWFLTGEHRNFKKKTGAFGRTKPANNFLGDGGPGAVEIAARYSTVDLSDGDTGGGEVDDVTVALNWYLNPNTRVMLDYVRSDAGSLGNLDLVETRFQLDF